MKLVRVDGEKKREEREYRVKSLYVRIRVITGTKQGERKGSREFIYRNTRNNRNKTEAEMKLLREGRQKETRVQRGDAWW